MKDDIVGYFKQVERFDYITIDLDKDETIIAGNVKQYDPSRLEQLIQSFKRTAQTCLEHNLRSPEELFAFWKGNRPPKKMDFIHIN
ncbi:MULTISPECIES: hypothetical protein [Bacillus]|uniref:Uncharacterized protein n=1 Tax=Bacillus wiedmannii TaxID=1890302 RepID=A0AB73SFP0_9BACI|nr:MULTISPECIES: hypothetical protein [Bacillus cereus group]MBJ8081236.1 hypothetical protein [Bacillus cereus group sp. N14]OAK14492.1 hypothetical protein A6281_12705 [Bacillus wiedmannii]OAK24182.1 hypothetical protein A6282_24535 [Bacillus wiedmannii]PEK25666.1 hypothetical protein CN694_09940 [Bacillus wiedmannii]HDR3491329.1 hypothetical protein [Bacillus wiedmannii]